jgi:hypothetical protein
LAHCFHGRSDATSALVVLGATFNAIRNSMLAFFACAFAVKADAVPSRRPSSFIGKPQRKMHADECHRPSRRRSFFPDVASSLVELGAEALLPLSGVR